MNYLVTGGAGFIGSHLVDRLLADGHKVLVLDNFFAGKERNLAQHKNNSSLKIFKQSVTEDITNVFNQGKIDAVFHLAALPRLQFSIDYPLEAHNVNINGTLNLLQACRNFGVKKFIFSSSSSIYGQQDKTPLVETLPPHIMVPYPLQKLTGEYYCQIYYQLYGIETVILRYFSVYGPRQNPKGPYGQAVPKFFDNVIHNKPPSITGDGTQTRNFTFVTDVVTANILAATTKNKKCFGEIFNIGNETGISIKNLAEIIIKLSGKKIKPIYEPTRIEAKNIYADSSKAKKLLNWFLKVSLEEGLKITYNYFLQSENP